MSPIVSRRFLRQSLGQNYLNDTIVGTTTGSWGTAGAIQVLDADKADPTMSGENMYFRHTLRLLGSAGVLQDARIASFNTGSGCFIAGVMAGTTLISGSAYEVHAIIEPAKKDRAITETLKRLRMRQLIRFDAIENGHIYSLGPEILDVLDVRYEADPTNSLERSNYGIAAWTPNLNGSQSELHITPAIGASCQLIIEALTTLTLGDSDLATTEIPSEAWLLNGAAARCYWMLEQEGPGKEVSHYKQRRQEVAKEFTRLSSKFQPFITRRVLTNERG